MSLDFARLLAEQESAEPDLVATFEVRRGTFSIPRELKELDPDEWARRYARGMPHGLPDVEVTSRPDGKLDLFTWRSIRVHYHEV